jgi:hypothetical protein
MTPDQRRDFYLKLSEAEMRSKDATAASLNQTVTTLIAVLGAHLYLIHRFPQGKESGLASLAIVLLTLAGACTLASIYFLATAWIGPTYSHFPPPDTLERWRTANKEYHDAHPKETPGLDERLTTGIINELAYATAKNRRANMERSSQVFCSRGIAIAALFLALIAAIPLFILERTP